MGFPASKSFSLAAALMTSCGQGAGCEKSNNRSLVQILEHQQPVVRCDDCNVGAHFHRLTADTQHKQASKAHRLLQAGDACLKHHVLQKCLHLCRRDHRPETGLAWQLQPGRQKLYSLPVGWPQHAASSGHRLPPSNTRRQGTAMPAVQCCSVCQHHPGNASGVSCIHFP